MKTVAKRDGDVYRINGSKMWATLGDECDVGILLAKNRSGCGCQRGHRLHCGAEEISRLHR